MGNIGTKRRGRIIAGAVGTAIGVIYTVMAFQLSMGRSAAPGPGVFPVVTGIFLIVASLGVAMESLVSAAIEGDIEFPRGPALLRVGIFAGATLVYIIVLSYVGLLVATILYFLVIIKALGKAGWLVPVIMSTVFAATVSVVFVVVLRVPLAILPAGLGI